MQSAIFRSGTENTLKMLINLYFKGHPQTKTLLDQAGMRTWPDSGLTASKKASCGRGGGQPGRLTARGNLKRCWGYLGLHACDPQ